MKRSFILAGLAALALALFPACGSKGGGGGGDGDNPFAQRKASIEAYLAAVEAAGADKAIDAGKTWLDANLAAYKANCTKLVEYRQDAEKSKLAKGHDTPFDVYFERVNKAVGFDPKEPNMDAMKVAGDIGVQFNSFFNCDNALKAP